MAGETKSGAQRARSYGLGASGLQGPGSAPYSTLLYSNLDCNVGHMKNGVIELTSECRYQGRFKRILCPVEK
jgi:hypothetical protein